MEGTEGANKAVKSVCVAHTLQTFSPRVPSFLIDGRIRQRKIFNLHLTLCSRQKNTTFCDRKDFNDVEGSNSKSKFFPSRVHSQQDIEKYGHQMKCITDDLTEIQGNYNTYSAQNLMVVFEKCDPEKQKCKSESEIL